MLDALGQGGGQPPDRAHQGRHAQSRRARRRASPATEAALTQAPGRLPAGAGDLGRTTAAGIPELRAAIARLLDRASAADAHCRGRTPLRLEDCRPHRREAAPMADASKDEQPDRPADDGPHPGRGAAAHAALRRGDRGHQIRRPRHGRRADRARLRAGRRAARADRDQPGGGARRRAADRRHAQEARHQVGIRRRPAHHRREDRRDRRDGAGRLDQQADRRLHQRRRRQGDRPVRQGRQHGAGQEGQPHRDRSRIPTSRRSSTSASSASPRRSTSPSSTR